MSNSRLDVSRAWVSTTRTDVRVNFMAWSRKYEQIARTAAAEG